MEDLVRRITQLERWRDTFIQNEVGRWRDWTPTVTQSGAVTVTATFARYMATANTIHLAAFLSVTGSGTTNNNIIITPPTGLGPAMVGHIGTGYIFDTSTGGIYFGSLVAVSATDIRLRLHSLTTASFMGINPNFGLASGDVITFQATYEKA